ncbi:hypothetical protein ADUPG1_000552, partial [Aduncisulcus paluster]
MITGTQDLSSIRGVSMESGSLSSLLELLKCLNGEISLKPLSKHFASLKARLECDGCDSACLPLFMHFISVLDVCSHSDNGSLYLTCGKDKPVLTSKKDEQQIIFEGETLDIRKYKSNPFAFAETESLKLIGGGFGEIYKFKHKPIRMDSSRMVIFKKFKTSSEISYENAEKMASNEYYCLLLLYQVSTRARKECKHDKGISEVDKPYVCVPKPGYLVKDEGKRKQCGIIMEPCIESLREFARDICPHIDDLGDKCDIAIRKFATKMLDSSGDSTQRLPCFPIFILARVIFELIRCMRTVQMCRKLCHKDIKPHNFLFAEREKQVRVVLTDFGGSHEASESLELSDHRDRETKHKLECISYEYMPHEIVQNLIHYRSVHWRPYHDIAATMMTIAALLNEGKATFSIKSFGERRNSKKILRL